MVQGAGLVLPDEPDDPMAARLRPPLLAVHHTRADDAGMMDAAPDQAYPDEVAMLLARCAQADGVAFRRLYGGGAALHRCLQEVQADRRKLVMPAFVEDLTHAEVAAHVGRTLGGVMSGIRRALRACVGGAA